MGKLAADDYFSGDYLEAARAITANDMTALRQIAAKLDDIDAPGRKEITLMWFAFSNERFEAIQTLIELGSNPGGQVTKGLGSPLLAAIRHKDIRYLKAMLDAGVDPNFKRNGEEPILQTAAGPFGNTLEHVKLLLEYGADINGRDSLRLTPLLRAINTHQSDVAVYLVEHGADVNAFTRNGVTMMWAVQSVIDSQQPDSPLRLDYERLRDRMIEKGAKYPPDPPKVVRAWARAQGMDMVLMDDD